MRTPLVTALAMFVPVALLAIFLPSWLSSALIVAMVAQMSLLTAAAKHLVELKREQGSVAYSLRYPFFVFGAGALCYGLVSLGYAKPTVAPFIAIVGAGAFLVATVWMGRGPLWPYETRPAAA